MQATFIIIREDLQVDPVTIVAEGLLVGRLPTCELLLNHPSVSRLHAGITSVEGDYYIRNLRRGNPIMLNGVPFEEYGALADGDVIGMGPFALNIHLVQGALAINVSLQIAATASDAVVRREASGLWDLPTTVHLELPSTQLEGSGCFLGQADYQRDQDGQAVAAFSTYRPAEWQGAICLDSHHRPEAALAGLGNAVGRDSDRLTGSGGRALLCAGICSGANFRRTCQSKHDFVACGGESCERWIVHFVSCSQNQHGSEVHVVPYD